MRIVPYMSCSVLFCSSWCDAVAVLTCPLCIPGHSVCTMHTSWTLSHSERNCSRFCSDPFEKPENDTFIISTHPFVPSSHYHIRTMIISIMRLRRGKNNGGGKTTRWKCVWAWSTAVSFAPSLAERWSLTVCADFYIKVLWSASCSAVRSPRTCHVKKFIFRVRR